MNGINKKYNLEIEVLTPLSIGAGQEKDWTRGIDFVVNNGSLYKLNLKKMLKEDVNPDELSSYFATKNESGLMRKFAGRLEAVSDAVIPLPIQSDNDVKAFVKNQLNGEPVLTGSSLKGAIRSVLFQYLGGNSKDGREVFGSSTDGDEFMRFMKISDAEFEETSLVNTKVFNLRKSQNEWLGGWKHRQTDSANSFTNGSFNPIGFNTLYECLMPKQKGYASFMLSERTFDNFNLVDFYKKKMADLQSQLNRERRDEKKKDWEKKINSITVLSSTVEEKNHVLSLSNLFSIINQHTRNYLKKERRFFEKYTADRTADIIDSINALLRQIPDDNSFCILKMSAGSGFHSITGDWQFEDFTEAPLDRKRVREGNVNPKSRKIAVWGDKLSLMGFVKLSAVSEEKIKQAEELRKVEVQRKQEEMRKKAEQEAKEKQEKEKRQARYNMAIAETKQLIDAEQYEVALELFQRACEVFPEGKQSEIDAALLKEKVKAIQEERAIEQRQREEAERRRQENAIPLSEKIAKAQKIPTLCGNVRTWMKQNGIESLDDDNLQVIYEKVKDIVSQMKPREQAKLTGFGKDLESLVGADTASCWFQEITQKKNSIL